MRQITVNAQLISTETGAHVWADRFEGERSKLGELQVEFVSRLANSLGVELVKAEALRAMRERPNNPDATDLAMRGTAIMNGIKSLASLNEAIGLFERALSLEFHYTPKHASWLNMVEIEIGVLKGQCLDRRIESCDRLVAEIDAWQSQRNQSGARNQLDVLYRQGENQNSARLSRSLDQKVIITAQGN